MDLKSFNSSYFNIDEALQYDEFNLVVSVYEYAKNKSIFEQLEENGYDITGPHSVGTSTDYVAYTMRLRSALRQPNKVKRYEAVEATIKRTDEKPARIVAGEFLNVLLLIDVAFEASQPTNYGEVTVKMQHLTNAEIKIIERYAFEHNGAIMIREI